MPVAVVEYIKVPADALPYPEYRQMVEVLLAKNSTTGSGPTTDRVEFTRLNEYRMNRVEKLTEVYPELAAKVRALPKPEVWLVLTEAWCGDSAQSIPVMHKVAQVSEGKVRLLLIGRDNHAELIDRFKTEGGRSIPKLLRLDESTGQVLGIWGPRPAPAQELMHQYKNSGGAMTKDEFQRQLHVWYARDRGATLQKELLDLLAG